MAHVIRRYNQGPISVILASNKQGRIEPFVFDDPRAAERAADNIEGKGDIETVLVWHGMELMDEAAAQRFTFGVRGLSGDEASRPGSPGT